MKVSFGVSRYLRLIFSFQDEHAILVDYRIIIEGERHNFQPSASWRRVEGLSVRRDGQ